jgi:hypothetical protein
MILLIIFKEMSQTRSLRSDVKRTNDFILWYDSSPKARPPLAMQIIKKISKVADVLSFVPESIVGILKNLPSLQRSEQPLKPQPL